MHYWGDGFPYFADVENVASEIGQFLRKWGRISVTQTKEKYGTARVYCHFGWYQLHSITHPGYVYSRFPDWLWRLDCRVLSRLIAPLSRHIVVPFHTWLYRLAYKRALKKYPHIREEILDGADWSELLEGL